MFVDRVKIFVKAGDGGRGCVELPARVLRPRGRPRRRHRRPRRRRRPRGRLPPEHPAAAALPHRVPRRARRHGGPGQPHRARRARDLLIAVPPGTLADDVDAGEIVGEVLQDGERLSVARGGRGGRGNRAFLSNRNRAPREAEPGEPGEERWLRLDLKLIADVGLLGVPNAGKSTLLSRHLGRAAQDRRLSLHHPPRCWASWRRTSRPSSPPTSPASSKGAHDGAGLGLQFLRHVERTRVLLHVVDASGASGRDPVADLRAVRDEVRGLEPVPPGAARSSWPPPSATRSPSPIRCPALGRRARPGPRGGAGLGRDRPGLRELKRRLAGAARPRPAAGAAVVADA